MLTFIGRVPQGFSGARSCDWSLALSAIDTARIEFLLRTGLWKSKLTHYPALARVAPQESSGAGFGGKGISRPAGFYVS